MLSANNKEKKKNEEKLSDINNLKKDAICT